MMHLIITSWILSVQEGPSKPLVLSISPALPCAMAVLVDTLPSLNSRCDCREFAHNTTHLQASPHPYLSSFSPQTFSSLEPSHASLHLTLPGIKKEDVYLELHLHGADRKQQVRELGVRVGDPILLDRPIRRGVGENSFTGAYLDNGMRFRGSACGAQKWTKIRNANTTTNWQPKKLNNFGTRVHLYITRTQQTPLTIFTASISCIFTLSPPQHTQFSPHITGLGCFVAAELARLISERSRPLQHVRLLSTLASHEEIGRFGSRVLAAVSIFTLCSPPTHPRSSANQIAHADASSLTLRRQLCMSRAIILAPKVFRPDVLIAVDVNHVRGRVEVWS